MGWKESLKTVAKTTATVAKKAAKTTADFTKETYKDLSSRPTSIFCSNEECHEKLDVPPLSEEEQKQERGDEFIICKKCNTKVKIPSTKFSKGVNTAVYKTKQAAKKGAKYAKESYHELKSRPKFIYCKNDQCRNKLNVPEITEEGEKKNKDLNKEEFVQCEKCQEKTKVPSTKFRENLSTAGFYTKKAAKTTANYAKGTYNHLKSAPEKFYCEHCNTKLHVPVVEGKPLSRCLCPTCNKETKIPTSNLSASVGKTVNVVSDVGKNVVYTVKKTKHVKCQNCKQQTKIPDDAKQEVKETESEVITSIPYVCTICNHEGVLVEKTIKNKDDIPLKES